MLIWTLASGTLVSESLIIVGDPIIKTIENKIAATSQKDAAPLKMIKAFCHKGLAKKEEGWFLSCSEILTKAPKGKRFIE